MARLSPCAESIRQHDYDRFATTLFAPAADREALSVLYAFNAEIARIREIVREPLLGHMRLQWWRDALDGVYAGRPPRHEVAQPLSDVVRSRRLDRDLFDELLDARAADLDDTPPRTLAVLERYAAGTSATLTRLALGVLGVADENAHAAGRDIGIAWALTGTVRAVPFQALRRRSMLPEDLCMAAGVDEEARFAVPAVDGLRSVVAHLAATAADHLSEAQARRRTVPKAALPALLVATFARADLRRITAAGNDPHNRRVATTSKPSRLLRAAAAALRGRY